VFVMNSNQQYMVFLSDGSVVAHTIDVSGECLREVILPAVEGHAAGEPVALVIVCCTASALLH
jgi:hypothetical protein